MKTKSSRRRLTWIAAIAAAGLLAACSPKDDGQKASDTASNVTLSDAQRQNIRLYTVARGGFHKMIESTGTVDFDNDQATSVVAPISGPVSRLLVSPGDHVAKGQALAAVDSPDYATAVGAYRKAITTAATLRRLADMDKDLLAHNGVSQREADQAQTDATGAEADRDAALQALLGLNVDPGVISAIQTGKPAGRIGGMIRSPLAGTVVERLVTAGQLLQAGTTPAFTVANLSRVWVMAQVFASDLASVHVGDHAVVETGVGGKSFSGTVGNVAALVDPTTRSIAVRVVVDNPGDYLKKQMYVHVRLESREESNGVLAPVSAILRDDQNLPFVYVVQSDNSYARQHVTLGYRSGESYEIASGLRPGQRIVADGAIFLQFMQNQ